MTEHKVVKGVTKVPPGIMRLTRKAVAGEADNYLGRLVVITVDSSDVAIDPALKEVERVWLHFKTKEDSE